ncbi:MAG: MerR family transcriptional regulator [Actinomycetota bacterium]|nr:MerR family transcriptional regulator [Actinomycetota bacterium]
MRIGEVAERAGVATSRIRYYERIGLLPAPERISGQRRYDDAVLRRLAVIDVAQDAGMTLDEIRTLIEHGNVPIGDVLRRVTGGKLAAIDALIDHAQQVRRWLAAAETCECQTIDACALFDQAPRHPDNPRPPGGRHT